MILYEDAIETLQLNKQNITVSHALINFRSMIDNGNTPHSNTSLIKSKNIIIRKWIEGQLEKQGHWNITSPYKDQCTKCNSTGEIYKLEKLKIECITCSGNGYLWLVCKTCKGSGRYKKRDQEYKDLIVNVKCNCSKFASHYGQQYKGKIRVCCVTCRGKGTIPGLKNFHYTGKIYSTTQCPQCKGYGFPISNKKLTQLIGTESTEHEDPMSLDISTPYVVSKIPVRTVHSTIDPSMIKLMKESI